MQHYENDDKQQKQFATKNENNPKTIQNAVRMALQQTFLEGSTGPQMLLAWMTDEER